jgi:hypothetical protein
VSQSSRIELAGAQINQSDRLSVELVKTDDREMTVIVWPRRPTQCRRASFRRPLRPGAAS